MDRLDRIEKFLEESARQQAANRAKADEELAELRRKNDKELAELRRQHATDKAKADKELAELRRKHDEARAKYDEELAELRRKHDKARAKYDEERAKTDKELAELNRKHAEARAKYDEERAKTDKELADLRRKHDEARAKYDKDRAGYDKERAEYDKERAKYDEERAKYDKEHDELRRQHAETNRIVRQTDTIWGSVAEGLALGEVMDVLNKLPGIEVHDYAARVQNRKRGNFEIDAVATGDHCVILMEARAHLRKEAIGEFVKKFKDYLEYYPEHSNKRIYGLVAFLNIDSYAKQLAIKKGLLILRSDYLNKEIVNPPPEFTPRDFNPKNKKL